MKNKPDSSCTCRVFKFSVPWVGRSPSSSPWSTENIPAHATPHQPRLLPWSLICTCCSLCLDCLSFLHPTDLFYQGSAQLSLCFSGKPLLTTHCLYLAEQTASSCMLGRPEPYVRSPAPLELPNARDQVARLERDRRGCVRSPNSSCLQLFESFQPRNQSCEQVVSVIIEASL